MVKIEALSLDHALNWVALNPHSKLVLKIALQPEVVIARQIRQFDTSIREFGEFREEAEVPLRHDGTVFEPVVEQIADDEQFFPVGVNEVQELNESAFLLTIFFFGTNTQVSV